MTPEEAWKYLKAKKKLEGKYPSMDTQCALAIVEEARRGHAEIQRLRADLEAARQEPPLYKWLLERESSIERIKHAAAEDLPRLVTELMVWENDHPRPDDDDDDEDPAFEAFMQQTMLENSRDRDDD